MPRKLSKTGKLMVWITKKEEKTPTFLTSSLSNFQVK